ncbi:MAG: pentapeptide repeat-containing protein, partial [Nitrospinae bacterium]|nr:pentapeptide repeat-containing protein [Nitrospinota bacterium]
MLEDWILKRIEVEKSKENLGGADLSNTKLIKAKLNNANLSDADLSD